MERRRRSVGQGPRRRIGAGGRGRAVTVAAFVALASLAADAEESRAEGPGEGLKESPIGPLAQRSKRTTTTKQKKRTARPKARVTKVRRTGPYLLAGVGLVTVGDGARGYDSVDPGPGFTVGFGHRLTNEFSLEANLLLSLHDAVEVRPQGGTVDPATNTMVGGTVDLKFWFPIQLPRVEGYGYVSIGYFSFDANRVDGNTFSGPGLGAGGGVDYRFTREFSGGVRLHFSQIFAEEQANVDGQLQTLDAQVPLVTVMPTAMIRL